MRADQFEALPDDVLARWSTFGRWPDRQYFPSLVGLQIEELKRDYCRMRLPYRPELEQPHGLVHGGALATLVDTVVVPAIGAAYGPDTQYMTLTMNLTYLGAVRAADVVAEGWVTRRGRSTVFCRAEATSEGRVVTEGSLIYAVREPR
jgi:uncharacterized protein (TIGR00369 family)